MDLPSPEEARASAAEPAPAWASDNAWWGMALTSIVLLGLAAAMFGIWWSDHEQRGRAVERYNPSASGTTRSYRTVSASGATRYQSSNTARQHGLSALNGLPIEAQAQIAARAIGVDDSELTAELYGTFLNSGAADLVMASESVTNYTTSGPFTVTTSIALVDANSVEIVALDGNLFNPPAPILDTTLAPGQERVASGIVGTNLPFTMTLRLEAREPAQSLIGSFDDCLRVRQILELGNVTTDARSWYCADIGMVREDLLAPDGTTSEHTEIIGISTPTRSSNAEMPAVSQPDVSAVASRAVANRAGDALGPTWSYREPGTTGAHITSPALLSEQQIFFGTVGGRVVAVDRQTHLATWRFETGGAIYGAPVLANGTLFVGSTDRKLYALDAHTGAFRWAFAARDAISGGPAVAGDRVFVGAEDRTLYAIDAQTGTERWRFQASASFASTPVVMQGVVYIGCDDGALYALDAGSGELGWAYATENGIESAPIVANDRVYVASRDGKLYALAAKPATRDGEVVWSRDVASSIEVDPVLASDMIIAQTADDEVHAIDVATGQPRWVYRSEIALRGAPLWFGERILLNSSGTIVALDPGGQPRERFDAGISSYAGLASDGREIVVGHQLGYISVLGDSSRQPWRATPRWTSNELQSELFTLQDVPGVPPVAYNDQLVFVTLAGRIYQIDGSDGRYELLGQASDVAGALLPPVVVGDTLLFGNQHGLVIAWDLAQRRERWRIQLEGRTFSAPAVVDERVLLASTGSGQASATAVDLRDGQPVWNKSFPFGLGVGSSAVLHGGRFYVVANAIHALRPADGAEEWAETGAIAPYQIAAADGTLYAVGYDQSFTTYLASFDAQDGRRLALVKVGIDSIPNLQGGITASATSVLLTTDGANVIAVDPATGDVRWRARETARIGAPPILHDNVALYTTLDNRLIARALDSGALLGDFSLQDASSTLNDAIVGPTIVGDQLYGAFYQQAFALPLVRSGGGQDQ